MIPSIKKILARCDGNLTRAMGYCSDMAQNYPHLAKEYMFYFEELLGMRGSSL